MKTIVMGTGPFAVPSFRWLLESHHSVIALVTRPIVDPGKRRKTAANPMLAVAQQRGITVIDPPDVNAPQIIKLLKDHKPDLLFVCDFGQILSSQCLSAAAKGGINLHGSLLPKYRGAAPVNWAIYHGEKITGVTVIHMTPKLDAGPSLVQLPIEIGPSENAEQLETRMAELGAGAIDQAIEMLEKWDGTSSIGQTQDQSLATKAPRLHKKDGFIRWERTANQIVNQIRAFKPWPGSYSFLLTQNQNPMRLIIHNAVASEQGSTQSPGFVEAVDQSSIKVATGAGVLKITELQPAGKRDMPVADFLRGRPVECGDRFGSSPSQIGPK